MAKEEFNYQEEIHIDQNRLDREWRRQPELFLKYALAYAEARTEADRAKESVALVKAQAEEGIRSGIEGKMPSLPQIAQMVLLDEDVQEAIAENTAAWERAGILQVAKEAFEHRKAALENLVRLHGQSYFSVPHVSGEEGDKGKEAVKQTAQRGQAKKVTRGNRTK